MDLNSRRLSERLQDNAASFRSVEQGIYLGEWKVLCRFDLHIQLGGPKADRNVVDTRPAMSKSSQHGYRYDDDQITHAR
ncbi:hypothetical protein [Sulfitobacter dubius]|uniref:hypothetical protein n=1 Tax=Sulfitobacter dubius TaxID=218673 RepID=UPI001FC9F71A|nr:hypothetical protein [Sulfitobacter dubius]